MWEGLSERLHVCLGALSGPLLPALSSNLLNIAELSSTKTRLQKASGDTGMLVELCMPWSCSFNLRLFAGVPSVSGAQGKGKP